jgi:1-pyrroline-5-carboxylate dehydrogenase
MLEDFRNEPFSNFENAETRSAFEAALARVERRSGAEVPLVVGGRRLRVRSLLDNRNPADRSQILSRHHLADRATARKAIEVGVRAQKAWQELPARERASVLLRAAARMRERKHEFSATMVLEIGKTWGEADVETAEAIDFLEFYAREALRWGGEIPVTPYRGEFPRTLYLALGTGAVIPPWNFPTAILTGMTSAALVTGNAVVLKPASDTPLVAWKVFEVLEEAGVPAGVLNYLPGSGSEIGDVIVEHPLIRFIAFTGSKEVGLRINQKASLQTPGQVWIKRAILEMGGKDFIVVDEDADFDVAVAQTVASAFGFQGQKCSACSRAIVHRRVYRRFVDAVVARTKKLVVGPPRDRKTNVGPVASERQLKTVTDYIRIGRREARLGTGGTWSGRTGNFVAPTVFYDVKPSHRIFREEIFGPVLAVTEAKDFEHAIRLANDSEYGLTGSYFGRDRYRIAGAKGRLFCGNLYINRKCTGALVGVHPFGGFNMSGTDSKAGGRDYLGLFLQAKSISEKLLGR